MLDYQNIVSTYEFPSSGIKSSYIKELLVREFGADIGFHARPHKNQSEVVYDIGGGVSYIEVAISSLGISNEQLVQNVASRLRDEVKSRTTVSWPPQVAELEQEENLSHILVQYISSLKKAGQVEPDVKARALASLLTYYVTGSPTTTSINLTMNLHGLTRSKELKRYVSQRGCLH